MALPTYVGRYKICKEIGRGSFATVVLAWDEELESSVALKILNVTDPEIEKRFLQEARLLRRVRAPNVVTVHDIGRLNNAQPYFVLDYADRGTLYERLPHPAHLLNLAVSDTAGGTSADQTGHLAGKQYMAELQALLLLVDALADGLSSIHAVGLVHRDIKPANILFESVRRTSVAEQLPFRQAGAVLISADERALVGDLGIAKDLTQGHDQPTLLGGTPLYLAPEQLEPHATLTSTVDIYASSAVLWNVLTGSPPPMPDRLQHALACLPNDWQSILQTGLHRNPDRRFQSMDEWRWAIHEIIGNAGRTVIYEPPDSALRAEECPYKGLAAYQPEDARYFCGREAMTDELIRRLQLHDVLVVGGPSGSGKSSLVRAGLIPALRAGCLPGSDQWKIQLLTPGADPIERLEPLIKPDIQTQTLWIVDQFEELFTLVTPSVRAQFINQLAAITDRVDCPGKIVIVVRADFYAECARETWLARRISNNQVLVGPLSASELRQAIAEPARRSGYFLERGLIEAILEQAGSEAGALPLVAHSLVETWVRRDGNTLTLAGFQAAGGVVGAISQSADAAYQHQLDDAGRQQARRLMLRLVVPGRSSPDTRRVLSRSDIASTDPAQAIDPSVIRVLTDARLLSIDDQSVQIAHEALLHRWPRLRDWIEESREDLWVRQKISRAANDWETEHRDPDFLYRGTPLLTAQEWFEHNPGLLSPLEQAFLEASQRSSIESRAAEHLRNQRARRLRRNALVSLTVLAIGTSVSTVVALNAYRDSQRNEALAAEATLAAESRFAIALGAAAFGHVKQDPRLSLVLAAESMAMSAPEAAPFDTRAAMISARQTLEQGGPFLFGSALVAGEALTIALNPQGSMLAIGSVDGALELIDTADRRIIQPAVKDHQGGLRDIAFSPDGSSMVSASADGTLRHWRPDQAGQWSSTLLAQTRDVIVDVDYMPDGQSVISANDDGSVQQYFLDGRGEQPPPIALSDFGFNTIGISADGLFLLTGNADKSISGYSVLSGERVMGPLTSLKSSHLVDISFNFNAKQFVSLDTSGVAQVADFPSGALLETQFNPDAPLGFVFFHPDRQRLISGDDSGRLSEWDAQSGALQKTSASGHSQKPIISALSADGRLLATLGRDQTIRFWTLGDHYPMAQEWQVSTGAAKAVSLSPDGHHLASGDENGLVQLRRLDTVDQPLALRGHNAGVWALAFSRDGRLLASADRAGVIRLWDAMNGLLIKELSVADEAVWSIAFASSDSVLLIGSDSGVQRYSISTQDWLDRLTTVEGQFTRMQISTDQQRLVTSESTGRVKLIDVESGDVLLDLHVDNDTIWSVALSPDGQTLASASGGEIVSVYSTSNGVRIARLTGHSGGATNVDFLADGATLVASDRKGRLHWWDLGTATRLSSPIQAHERAIWRLQVHADGQQVVTSGDDGAIRLWNVLDIERACSIGLPGFDITRRNQYLGADRAYSAC